MPALITRINDVVVYVDRARITRLGSIAVEPGSLILEVSDLPGRLNPESLRATAHGTARARLGGVQAQRQHPLEAPQEAVRELERDLEEVQDQRRMLEGRIELGNQNRQALVELLGETATYATALAAGELSLEKGLETLEALRARAERLDIEVQSLKVEKRGIERREQQLVLAVQGHNPARAALAVRELGYWAGR
ncbi:MAG TPA: DUF4140 domain-containing protein, partial [Anaerolineales bacterium]|nr:DUF4140 domain-containing protein [Anaerolineales bacterium]